MEFTAKQIAELVQGTIVGDENAKVHTFAKIEEGKEGSICFLASAAYSQYIESTEASVVLVDKSIKIDHAVKPTLIYVEHVRECVARLLQMYAAAQPRKTGISDLAYIAPTAKVGKDAYVGPYAVIEDGATVGDRAQIHAHACVGVGATVGDDCLLYPHSVIYHDCRLGNGVTLHSGAVVGADGFGFAPTADGYDKIPQLGIVIVEDNVEIGANTCIDRATMGATVVRRGVKLDNLVQIAHNVEVGAHTVMSAQVGIAGSTKVGEWCMFGGQVGISGHIRIGDRVHLGAQSGVPGSLDSDQELIGTPPQRKLAYFKSQALVQRLPEIVQQMRSLEQELKEIKQKLNQ